MIELTYENLKKLVEIGSSYNDFIDNYLFIKFEETVKEEAANGFYTNYLNVFLVVLYFLSYDLYRIDEFKEEAVEFLNKDLDDMPMFITPVKSKYNWIPIVARWRLNCRL